MLPTPARSGKRTGESTYQPKRVLGSGCTIRSKTPGSARNSKLPSWFTSPPALRGEGSVLPRLASIRFGWTAEGEAVMRTFAASGAAPNQSCAFPLTLTATGNSIRRPAWISGDGPISQVVLATARHGEISVGPDSEHVADSP